MINQRSPEWLAIAAYAQERIAAMTEEAMGTACSDELRRDRVARVDELRLLLRAPADQLAAARARQLDLLPTAAY